MARLPILNLPRFIEAHGTRNRLNYAYIHTNRGRTRVLPAVREELTFRSACSLYANNHFARIAFARAGEFEFRRLSRRCKLREFHFVTLIPPKFSMPLVRAGRADLNELRRLIFDLFGKFDYFGIIEAGYFSTGLEGERAHRAVSWHVHIIVWNAGAGEVPAIVDRINKEADLHWKPARADPHGIDGAASRIIYVMKTPVDEHRISVKLTPDGTSPPRKYARPIRTGDAFDVSRLFMGKTIPQLFVSSGQGAELERQIIAHAEKALQADEDRHVAELQRLLGQ